MIYDGIVIKIDKLLYLFILDPDAEEMTDGFNISEHACYKDMKSNQLMVVKVTFKDGTQEIDKIDLDEFIHGDSYGKYDTFLHIKDISLFSIGQQNDKTDNINNISLKNVLKKGELTHVAMECIESTKKESNENV